MKQQLHMITLGVNDWETAVNFFEVGLGWKRSVASQGDIVFLNLNRITLSIPKKHWRKMPILASKEAAFRGLLFLIMLLQKLKWMLL